MLSSMVCLLWAFVMIGLVILVFSIIFGNAAASHFEAVDMNDADAVIRAVAIHDHFGSMYNSAVSLFSAITGGNDWMSYGENLILLDEESHIYFLLFLFYIGFCLVGMLNVVTGIFVDSAVCTRTEDEVVDSYTEDLTRTSEEVRRIFQQADEDGSGVLTQAEFEKCLEGNQWVAAYFSGLDIDTSDASTIFTLMDIDGSGELSIDEFVEGTMKLKGSAKSIDIFSLMFDHAKMAIQLTKLCSLVEDEFKFLHEEFKYNRAPDHDRRLFKPVNEMLKDLNMNSNEVLDESVMVRRARTSLRAF